MKTATSGLLKKICFFCVFFLSLIFTGCHSHSSGNPPAVQAGIYGSTVVEGADDLEFVISLSVESAATVSVDYATSDGTALAGTDYSAISGTVQFAPGEKRKFVTVPVISNASLPTTTSKSMQLVLSHPLNATLSSQYTAVGTIIDSDAMSANTLFDANWAATGAFTNAATCGASCHETDNSSIMFFNGKDISPNTQWQHSVMANSFSDPYWQAAVEDESHSFPNLSGFIEDTCTKCHAPMGHTHAHQTDTSLDIENYYRLDTAETENHAREGVSCTACHQIDASNLGSPDSFSGNYVIADSLDPNYKNIYGPYDNPMGNNMANQTGHTPTAGAYVASSEICASCHTLYTPTLDPDTGTPTGISFLEQGPYLEWQNSVYATGSAQEAQCQECHMPEPFAGYSTKISLLPPGTLPDRTPYGQHALLGGNSHLLEILRDYRIELGIDASSTVAGFDDQIAQTQGFLGTAASIAVSPSVQVANNLEFNVTVTNHAGHKLPSSYPSRRVWLHVAVKDNAGNIIFESGKPDARGHISTDEARLKADCMSSHKLDGFASSVCYEPHRNVIAEPSQVAIYETVLADIHDNITHVLLQSARYLKDNRIPPAGFSNSKASTIESQTIPSGVDGDSDFNCVSLNEGCGADAVHYQVNIEGAAGPYTIESRLLYQATQPGFADGMHSTGDRVNRFKVIYDAVPPTVEVLDTATTS